MQFTNLFGLLRNAINDSHHIDKEIAKLEAERAKVEAAPPHTTDLVNWALRGLDTAQESFLGRLKRWHFSDQTLTAWPGAHFETHSGPQILALSQMAPTQGHVTPAPIGNQPDLAAVTFFLAPAIREMLPKLVEESFSAARKGTKAADRKKKLAEIDNKLEELRAKRDELLAGISEAHRAISQPAKGADSDQAIAESRERAETLAAGEVTNVGHV
jgi:hypothetical protein